MSVSYNFAVSPDEAYRQGKHLLKNLCLQESVPAARKAGIRFLKSAAHNDHPRAQFALAMQYLQGASNCSIKYGHILTNPPILSKF